MNRIFTKLIGAGTAAALLLGGSLLVHAQDTHDVVIETPIVVTTIGRSLDAFQVQLGLQRGNIDNHYNAELNAPDLGEDKTLLLVIGASVKGFGEAGISIEQEIDRLHQLIDAAEESGISVLVAHTGGSQRRDSMTDQLLTESVPRADAVLISESSDSDGFITGLTADGVSVLPYTGNVITGFPSAIEPLLQ